MIRILLGSEPDIDAWMRLAGKVSGSFPGLETSDALDRAGIYGQAGSRLRKVRRRRRGSPAVFPQSNTLCFSAVAPQRRRRHIAEDMFFFALPLMTQGKAVSVTTWREGAPEGAAARAFYQKIGFLPGRLTEEFGTGVQEFVRPYHALV